MFDAIGETGIVWRGQTTTKAPYDQLKRAKESGCLELAIGVETVDEGVMKIINKVDLILKRKLFLLNDLKLDLRDMVLHFSNIYYLIS